MENLNTKLETVDKILTTADETLQHLILLTDHSDEKNYLKWKKQMCLKGEYED